MFHHLPSAVLKQLCVLAHLECHLRYGCYIVHNKTKNYVNYFSTRIKNRAWIEAYSHYIKYGYQNVHILDKHNLTKHKQPKVTSYVNKCL